MQTPVRARLFHPHVAAALLALVLTGCAAAVPPFRGLGPAPTHAWDRALRRFSARYVERVLRLDPSGGSESGYTSHDARLPSFEPSAVETARVDLQVLARELARIPESRLSPSFAADRRLIERHLRDTLRGLDQPVDVFRLARTIRASATSLLRPEADRARVRPAWVARMRGLRELCEGAETIDPSPMARRLAVGELESARRIFEGPIRAIFSGSDLEADFDRSLPIALSAIGLLEARLEEAPRDSARPSPPEGWRARLAEDGSFSEDQIRAIATVGLEETRQRMNVLAQDLFSERWPERTVTSSDAMVDAVLDAARREHRVDGAVTSAVDGAYQSIAEFIESRAGLELPEELIASDPAHRSGAFFDGPVFSKRLPNGEPRVVPGNGDGGGEPESPTIHELTEVAKHELLHRLLVHYARNARGASEPRKHLWSAVTREAWVTLAKEVLDEEGLGRDHPIPQLFALKVRMHLFADALYALAFLHGLRPAELDALAEDLLIGRAHQTAAEARWARALIEWDPLRRLRHLAAHAELVAIDAELRDAQDPAFSPFDRLEQMLYYGAVDPKEIRNLLQADGRLAAPAAQAAKRGH